MIGKDWGLEINILVTNGCEVSSRRCIASSN
jgi:hypothetical protein